ncbi:O-acyltransferase like protein [Orussus abietinus]|uniref:O-acyltransferase like protein n=1 Tax=Orussus abietinus TaxID=222816 RepID=UPI000C715F9F|nr:O-acyltransferase like protein [Orussus abietinus]
MTLFFNTLLGIFLCDSVISLKLLEATETSRISELENISAFQNDPIEEKINSKKGRAILPSVEFWPQSNNSDIVTDNEDEPIDLDKLLEVWNPKSVAKNWGFRRAKQINVSTRCDDDVTRYLSGVLRGEKWALKMIDSSGKHTWGLFYGNQYWIGAPNQCRDMDKNFTERLKNETASLIETPPFRVSVNAIRLKLDILKPEINESLNITLGVCFPASCSVRDVKELMDFAVNKSKSENLPRKLVIDHVRNLSEGYSFWDDPVFYILVASFVIPIILIILGTLYDISLRYRILKQERGKPTSDNPMLELKILGTNGDLDDEITLSKLWSIKTHNGSLDVQNEKDVPKPLSEALLSFSLLLNISKLASLDVGSDTLAPIHGIRVFSMIWIILVHTCLAYNNVSDTKMFRMHAEDDFLYQTISNATYAVDTFFVISGCLVAFLYFRTNNHQRMKERTITKGFSGKVFQFLGMVFYRYFRLTPPYLLVIGLIQVSMKWYHDHAIIEISAPDYKTCEKFWWRNALYINSFIEQKERCMGWSWYLANDTQFYIIGIIIMIIAASYLHFAMFAVCFLLVLSWITTGVIAFYTDHIPTIQDPFAHYESLYDKPWTRIGSYLIGIALGWYLFKINCKVHMNKLLVVIGWVLSLVTMASIVYGLYGHNFGPILASIHTALSHSGWALCIAWIIFACVTGHGGLINSLLSWKYLYPLSRLTYCTYLIHPVIIRVLILAAETSSHLTSSLVAILFFGIAITSYAVSLILSLLFEAPMVSMLRIIHPLRQWKRK